MRRVAPGALPCPSQQVPRDDVTSDRPELPSRADTLEPMGEAFETALDTGLDELGLLDTEAGSKRARRSYEMHARLLREWGAAINLTAIRDPAEMARRHVCDSLSAALSLVEQARLGGSLLDIGSGAGYPGMPLAAALSLGRVGLLDSVGKKVRFLSVAAEGVTSALDDGVSSVPAIEAIAARAEDLAEEPDQRAGWQIVTARAVGSLAEVVELGMPMTREGGVLVAWKREEERHRLRDELRDAGSIIRATGGGRPEVVVVGARSLNGHRLVIIPKERPTPADYPRPVAKRAGRKH